MGFRFNRRVRLFGGIYMNFSKGGTSLTARAKGLSITSGKKSARLTVGLPGTGLSYTKSFSKTQKAARSPSQNGRVAGAAPTRGRAFRFFFTVGLITWILIFLAILWAVLA